MIRRSIGRSGTASACWICAFLLLSQIMLTGCRGRPPVPDFAALYNQPAQAIGDDRTPVIVIPGILGSKLEDDDTTRPVWGSFTFGAVDPDFPAGAQTVGLPMRLDVPLSALRDKVRATTVLDNIAADVGLLRSLEIGAYVDILQTLAAGDYRDQMLGDSGAIDYGGAHYTCFQFAYDWRRDISEQAADLHRLILSAQDAVRLGRRLESDAPVKVDVIAHSMGGLVLRYYLRYGPQPLPEDGSLPELTWAGAEHVDRAILIGTPNAGSVQSLEQLITGLDLNPLFPNYRAAILGTMPSIYQLLPRTRHARVLDSEGRPIDLFDPEVWKTYRWGLADPRQARTIAWLLPEFDSPELRRRIALDHLEKCLDRARQLHLALDRPADRPDGLELHLIAGDAIDTPSIIRVERDGRLRYIVDEPGDQTVTRASALMDERVGDVHHPYLRSPIDWTSVLFLHADHLGLTRDPAFIDNLLYKLLEEPRGSDTSPGLLLRQPRGDAS